MPGDRSIRKTIKSSFGKISFAIAACTALSACSSTRNIDDRPKPDASKDKIQTHVDAFRVPGAENRSKYSPAKTLFINDDYKGDLLANPDKALANQSVYGEANPRVHLIDHFIDNTPPEYIPLTNWRYDFIAGELALDATDFLEAKGMFGMALAAAKNETPVTGVAHQTLANIRLAYIARKTNNIKKAEELYLHAMPELQRDPRKYGAALEMVLRDLALIRWNQHRNSDAENYLWQRVAATKQRSGEISSVAIAAQNDLANCLYYQKKFTAADKLYLYCAALALRLIDESNYSMKAVANLANCRFSEHKYADALELYSSLENKRNLYQMNRIAECNNQLAKLPESERKARQLPPQVGDTEAWNNLIIAARDDIQSHRLPEARALLLAANREALALQRPDLMAETAIISADADFAEYNFTRALDAYRKNIAVLNGANLQAPKKLLQRARIKQLLCELTQKDYTAAESTLKQVRLAVTDEDWRSIISDLNVLFATKKISDRDKKYEEVLNEICANCLRSAKSNTTQKAIAQANLAQSYWQAAQQTKAISVYVEALQTAKTALDKDDAQTAQIENALGLIYLSSRDYVHAKQLFSNALASAERHPGENNEKLITQLQWMQALYNNMNLPDEEEASYKRIIALKAPAPPSLAQNERLNEIQTLARIDVKRGDLNSAARNFEEIIKMKTAIAGQDREISEFTHQLSAIYERSGEYAKLEQLFERKVKNMPLEERDSPTGVLTRYLAAQAAFRYGNYKAAIGGVEAALASIETLEADNKHQGAQNIGTLKSNCLNLLGDSLLDGAADYTRATAAFDRTYVPNQVASAPALRRPNQTQAVRPGPKEQASLEQQINALICATALGDSARSQEYREHLNDFLVALTSAQTPHTEEFNVSHRTTELLDKSKRSRLEDVELMELMPYAVYLLSQRNQTTGMELIERAIVLRTSGLKVEAGKSKENQKAITRDFSSLLKIYVQTKKSDRAEPLAIRQLNWLRSIHASREQIGIATCELADSTRLTGFPTVAKKIYLQASTDTQSQPNNFQFSLYKNLADCSEQLGENNETLKYLNSCLKFADKDSIEYRLTLMRIATMNDIEGRSAEALNFYKRACDKLTDLDEVLEPLRLAANRCEEENHYTLANTLCHHQIELISRHGKSPIALANVWLRIARMYRSAKMDNQSRSAYKQVIAICNANEGDNFLTGMLDTAEAELKNLNRNSSFTTAKQP